MGPVRSAGSLVVLATSLWVTTVSAAAQTPFSAAIVGTARDTTAAVLAGLSCYRCFRLRTMALIRL